MLYDFSKKSDISYKGLSDIPSKPISIPSSNQVQQQNTSVDMNRKTYTGSFWQKAGDVLGTLSNATGGFLTGARKKSEEIQQSTPKGQIPIFNRPTAPIESLWAGVKNIPQGIEKRIDPGKYMKDTLAPGSTGIVKSIAENPVAQFAANVVVDPINVLPFGKIAQGIGKVTNKIPGVAKATEIGGQALSKIGELPIVQKLAKTFIKGHGVEKDVVGAFDNISNKAGIVAEEIVNKQKALMSGLSDKAIKSIPYLLEPEIAKKAGVDTVKLIEELGPEYQKMLPVIAEEKSILKGLAEDYIKRNNVSPEIAKDYITRDYFPHVFEDAKTATDKIKGFVSDITSGTKVGVKNAFWNKRKGAEGFSLNTPFAVAKRQIAQITDNFTQDAILDIAKKYGQEIKMIGDKATDVPEGFKMVSGTHTRLKDLRNIALPNNIADYIDQTLKQKNVVTRFLDGFNSYWKPTATSMNPGFHLTNMIGNMYNSFLGGVTNPKRFFQMVVGGFDEEEKALIKSSGILQRGEFTGDALKEAFGIGKEKIFKYPNKIGRFIENNARQSLFLDAYGKLASQGMDKSKAVEEAVKTVDKYLFDYQKALAPSERNIIKSFFPFYTWFRKNLPLQASSVWNQTGKPAAALKTIKALNNGEMPEDLSIPAGKDTKGNDLRWKVPLPLQDIGSVTTTDTSRDMLSPLVKMMGSHGNWIWTKGKQVPTDYFTGQKYSDAPPGAMQTRDVIGNTIIKNIRPARTIQKIQKDNSAGNVLRSLMGGFSKSISPDSKASNERYDREELIKQWKTTLKNAIESGDTNRALEAQNELKKLE